MNNEYYDKGRIEYFDMAKGLGMMCIIAGHMGINIVNRCVYTFHIPFFMLISGYFISTNNSIKNFGKKRVKALTIPYAVTCILLMVAELINCAIHKNGKVLNKIFGIFVSGVYGSGNERNLSPSGIEPIGAIWFLPALLWAAILVRWAIENRYGWIVIVLWSVAAFWSAQYIWLPFDVQAAGFAAIYVFIGAFARKRQFSFDKQNTIAIIGGAIVLAIEFLTKSGVAVDRCYAQNGFLSIPGAVVISYFVLWFVKKLERVYCIKKVLCFFGENSIIILSLHLVELKNIPWDMITHFPWQIVNLICIFAYKLLFVSVCSVIVLKIKPLRKWYGR